MKKYLITLLLSALSLTATAQQAYRYMKSGISTVVIDRPYVHPTTGSTIWEFSEDNVVNQSENQLTWKFRQYNRTTGVLTSTAYFFTREYQGGIPLDWWNSYYGYSFTTTSWSPGDPFPSDPYPSSSSWFYNGSHPYYSRGSVAFNSGSKIVTVGNARYHVAESSTMKIVNNTDVSYETEIWWIWTSNLPSTYLKICVPEGGTAEVSPNRTAGNWTYPWVGFSAIESRFVLSCE